MPIRQVEERAPRRRRIGRAGRVVGIDDDERARRRRHEAAQVIEIRHPPAVGIGPIEQRARAELGDDGRVQRIGRHRHQHFAVFVDERAERELDAFGRAGREKRAIRRDGKPARRVLRGDRFASRRDARRRPVAVVAVVHRPLDGGDEVRRRLEAERHRVADVQVTHVPAAGFDPLRLDDDVANGVGEAVEAGSDGNRVWRFSRGPRAILPR